MNSWVTWIEGTGPWAPWLFVGVFLGASLLTIWRLESMSAGGLEGTVLGTLITPYITGLGNLIFAFVMGMGKTPDAATQVMTNCLVNNVTNMTLVLGVPAIFWSMNVLPAKKDGGRKAAKKGAVTHEVNRLSLLLTLTAVLFFTGTTWVLGQDGQISFTDGLVLVGIFVFWQCFHIFEVLKSNVRQNKRFSLKLWFDLALVGVGAWGVYVSTNWLVDWVKHIHTGGFINADNLGWLSGWLDVLPNAMLAIYYAWTRRPEIVYTSQVGDGHICIPLCIGIFALFEPIATPPFFRIGVIILLAASLVHFFFIALMGRLPRYMGWVLTAAYIVFLCVGLSK